MNAFCCVGVRVGLEPPPPPPPPAPALGRPVNVTPCCWRHVLNALKFLLPDVVDVPLVVVLDGGEAELDPHALTTSAQTTPAAATTNHVVARLTSRFLSG